MASLDKVKNRIKSVSATLKITKAMELVATAKLKKAKENNLAIQDYLQLLRKTSQIITPVINAQNNIYLNERKGATVFLLVTTDLGLCGGLNINAFKLLKVHYQKGDEVICFGRKGTNSVIINNYHSNHHYDNDQDQIDFRKINLVTEDILQLYNNDHKDFTYVKLITNNFINNATFETVIINLLPIIPDPNLIVNKQMEFEPSADGVLAMYIPLYLSGLIYGKIIEAKFVEQASRRLAMEAASDNAQDIIDELKISYNKTRQANITQEIAEIISGISV